MYGSGSQLRFLVACAIVGVLGGLASAEPIPHHHHGHDHSDVAPGLVLAEGDWYHPDDHPAVQLFRRQNSSSTLPPVGSSIWASRYPQQVSYDPNQLPAAWVAALNAAVAAGKIPSIPQAQAAGNYGQGVDATSPQICSSTYQCRAPGDIWDAPAGVVGISFDDGPLQPSPTLYSFLQAQNISATHFMIGTNILYNPQIFLQAFNQGGHIAVHTWTHPYMTTLSNYAVLAELGWTMQIMHDSTGGRVPRFWRPPYGDSDNRVRAIATEVFGLTTVIWNHDTADWQMNTPGGPTPDQVNGELQSWYTGPKTPGLVILEHELSDLSVQAFITNFPLIAQNGWRMTNIAGIAPNSTAMYQNSVDDTSAVQSMDILASGLELPTTTSTMPAPTTTAPASTTSASHHSGALPRTQLSYSNVSFFAIALLGLFLTL